MIHTTQVARSIVLFTLIAVTPACKTNGTSTVTSPPAAGAQENLDGRPLVSNPEAKPGDVTTCPFSGRKFVVEADSPRLEYQGRSYVLCSEKARDVVAADPAKYLPADAAPP